MLEYNYDDLDDQFVTIWSNYFLYQDKSMIMRNLEKLAEMGQINAVQSWYLFKTKGDNRIIDSIVESYTGANYNELFAMANYESSKDDVKQEYQELLNLRNDYVKDYYNSYANGDVDERYIEKIHNIDADILNLPFIKKYDQAKEIIINLSKMHGDPIFRVRACEMLLTFVNFATSYQNTKQMMYLKVANNGCIKSLLKKYKEELKKNPNFTVSDNPQLCYSLAKAIAFRKNKKHKKLGNALFKELSQRALNITSFQSSFSQKSTQPQISSKNGNTSIKQHIQTAQESFIEEIFNEAQQQVEDSCEK